MTLSDSRRLTGPNLLLDGPGAAAEITVSQEDLEPSIALWRSHVERLLREVGWGRERSAVRRYAGGATLAITAPMDALYVATEIVEAAWELTVADITKSGAPDFNTMTASLIAEIKDENSPELLALRDAAESHDVTLLPDDETVTLGLGKYSQSWPREAIPEPDAVDWAGLRDIPTALVTGTNGKSTTVRIAAAMGAAAGQTVGFSSSDWVKAGEEIIAAGDYSGPEGARLALRDTRVDMAVIETARGGLLRRGLPLPKTTACLVTNVAADHLGDYGILDVDALADTKFTVSKAVKSSGVLVLNADDARLKTRGDAFSGEVAWYGLSLTQDDVPSKGFLAFVQNEIFMLAENGNILPILPITDFGPALGGAAQYNVANALGAMLLMRVLGLPIKAIKQGLLDFESAPEDNPGRGNFLKVGGVKIVLDFAHNPHGLSALTSALSTVPAKRRLYLCGQGGDRSDEDIRGLTQVIREAEPEAIVIKDIPTKLRGRAPGEVPRLITEYLSEMDYPNKQILQASSEIDAVVKALEWARPDDLLVLLVYAEREGALSLIRKLERENWTPGEPVLL